MNKKVVVSIAVAIVIVAIVGIIALSNMNQNDDLNKNVENTNNEYVENVNETEDTGNEYSENIEKNENIISDVPSIDVSVETLPENLNENEDLSYERKETAEAASTNITLKDINVLDREKMVQAAENFASIYFDMTDVNARRMNLAGVLDVSYIQEKGRSSILYIDYIENNGQGYAVGSDTRYIGSQLNSIDNASIDNAVVRLDITFGHMQSFQASEDGPAPAPEYVEDTVTYQIYLNNDYKVKNIKVAAA